jgi:hypothetical protein
MGWEILNLGGYLDNEASRFHIYRAFRLCVFECEKNPKVNKFFLFFINNPIKYPKRSKITRGEKKSVRRKEKDH